MKNNNKPKPLTKRSDTKFPSPSIKREIKDEIKLLIPRLESVILTIDDDYATLDDIIIFLEKLEKEIK